jgi:NAD(P)H-hydrate repair Nnr-like enzyme with NAD(P)H-hydrate dehydratase domain
MLKGSTSLVADHEGRLFAYAGGGVGLATGGSGDVLAGIAAGLAARGASPLDAALWAVWLHGEAGRRCAEQIGPVGFLARELLAHVPGLMKAI